jgi:AcrR family transcriptional regulator
MARPPTIRDEEILEAARAVFLARGVQATTAEVAERAGISEGSIFNRFKSKEELFFAAMRPHGDGPPEWVTSLERRVGKGDPKEQLYELGLEIIAFFRETIPLTMMTWSNKPAEGGLPKHLASPNPPPLRGLKAVVRFFEAEVRAGRMHRHDPEVLARSYMGSLHTFAFFDVLYRAHDEESLAAEEYVRGLVQLIWSGAAPRRNGKGE